MASLLPSQHQHVVPVPDNVLLIHERQHGNPLIKHIRNIRFEFTVDSNADYLTSSTCIIFVSIRYHLLHANYTSMRLLGIGVNYRLRVLLILADESNMRAIAELNHLAFANDFTLVLAWSELECARYLECLKVIRVVVRLFTSC